MHPPPPTRSVLWVVACLAALAQAANLLYVAGTEGCTSPTLACVEVDRPFATADTGSYLVVAQQIHEKGVLGASYHKRTPGYPLALGASLELTGRPGPALWLSPLLAAVAAASIAWIAGWLASSAWAALAAGLLFSVWPDAYRYSVLFMTDAPHAFCAVSALAATLWWRRTERPVTAVLAFAFWAAAQALRPTFVVLPLLLPLLLLKRGGGSLYKKISVALCVGSCLIPTFLVTSNYLKHGVAAPSVLPAAALACYSVSRLKAEMGRGPFREHRRTCTDAYRELPLAERVSQQLRYGRRFLLAHPRKALRSYAGELSEQLLFPLRPFYFSALHAAYPGWTRLPSPFLAAFWLCALAALVWTARREPGLALFLLLGFVLVMLPAANSHDVGGRLRFPLDLFFLPVVVAGGAALLGSARARLRAAPRRPR